MDVSDLGLKAKRCLFPWVTGGFLWPFAGAPHPLNERLPFLKVGPFPGEFGDNYLNRRILAVLHRRRRWRNTWRLYNSVRNLDRLFELFMDRQRRRDQLTGFSIADIVSGRFRDEQLFFSPNHPDLRICMAVAEQLFQKIGVPQDRIEWMRNTCVSHRTERCSRSIQVSSATSG